MSQDQMAPTTADSHSDQLDGKQSFRTIQGWTEKTANVNWIGPADPFPCQVVGGAGIYYDNIYDENGTVVGHTVGYVEAIHKRPSDGHIFVTYHESIELSGGTLAANGTIDVNEMAAGAWIHLNLNGTSGEFLGKSGSRSWKVIPPLEERNAHIRMTFWE
jgi:hypothetical protein